MQDTCKDAREVPPLFGSAKVPFQRRLIFFRARLQYIEFLFVFSNNKQ